MPCYSPLPAIRPEGGGKLEFGCRPESADLYVPCGQCIGCKLDRSVSWAVRVMCEAQLHEHSSFVTLTYRDECVPYAGGLHYPHFQDFMKSLRYRFGMFDVNCWQHVPRFFMCGEYGEQLKRPHYHAILFGCHFPDRREWRQSSAGFPLYRSDLLEKCWPHGQCEIGDVSFDSAAYVARYCTKKITGPNAEAHYERLVPETGEIVRIPSEFARMSLKPGVGATWVDRFSNDFTSRDSVVLEGRTVPVPRYFLNRLPYYKEEHDHRLALKAAYEYHDGLRGENGPERLRVKEIVARAKLALKTRSLE